MVALTASILLAATFWPGRAAAVPPFDGAMTFPAIQGPLEPEEFSWEVQLGPDQELQPIDEHHAGVYYVDDDVLSFLIEAGPAHDADGTPVPTTLEVTQPNIITLVVHHREGNPTADGAPFVYPITAGQGWTTSYREPILIRGPKDEQELREEQETNLRREEEARDEPRATLPRAQILTKRALVRGHPWTKLAVRCEAESGSACSGSIRLSGICRVGRCRAKTYGARHRFTLTAGSERPVLVHLRPDFVGWLEERRRVKVRATISLEGGLYSQKTVTVRERR